MKLGIVSDIHEAVELLEAALGEFRARGVDRVVALGDVFETGARLAHAVALLRDAGAVGVYGNHDHGLCVDPSDYVRDRHAADVLAFMGTLGPRLDIDGFLFAHREPWLDAREVAEIWHVDEQALGPESVARCFAATPHRAILIGHYHRWLALGRSGPLAWDGSGPFDFPGDEPTLMVVHAVCDGHAAILDTRAAGGRLVPLDLYAIRGWDRPADRPLPRLVP